MVEAIETLFVPVAIYNNVEGKDARVLASYKEPTWNNPVTRLVDAAGKDIIPRKDRVWTARGMAPRMLQALIKGRREAPRWFRDHVTGLGTEPRSPGVTAVGAATPLLDKTLMGLLPLTPRQAARLEAGHVEGKIDETLLSPRQRKLLSRLQVAKKSQLKSLARPRNDQGLAAYEAKVRAALDGGTKG